ncbi:hypothetical protein JTE90_012902 [Oedothorax gibbosus]|uniref:Uncharacterized protein n=1 Tax=Oedothorax gibbosus TaxID=931172 RepID=A0AAV6U236_9ARAC|nr:hypothetical protein JTE90_012902 [Oedothorax gibbosus]
MRIFSIEYCTRQHHDPVLQHRPHHRLGCCLLHRLCAGPSPSAPLPGSSSRGQLHSALPRLVEHHPLAQRDTRQFHGGFLLRNECEILRNETFIGPAQLDRSCH